MDPIISGAAVGFITGAFGFIIVKFWIIPISRYRRLKRNASELLASFEENASPGKERNEICRKLSVAISDSFVLEIPHWYKMMLANRQEIPEDGASHLMKLANTKEEHHIRTRMEKIREALKLEK